ncbi:bucentaur or craniofacial development-domain-containing protein [Ephemerocybe angulata]|uniref:SWR1-complex protein 5 n=1 Tax=Ephemerocybe angulata TaxID=980116 RepID=A0A8H6HK08_9AGAR|nr:bucentaur or craniofacial development-domain-containing protein [Tulosesus angulatus]
MNSSLKRPAEDDSEDDDEDYVPPKEENGSSSESEDESGTQGAVQEVETKGEKKDLSKVWQDFQATVAGTSAKPIQRGDSDGGEGTKVKVVKKFRFAGQEHEWRGSISSENKLLIRHEWMHREVVENRQPQPQPLHLSFQNANPAPRKPKTTLAPLPSKSAPLKKLTTLEKSALDWAKHTAQPSSSDGVAPTAEELEAHRRGGGGYLDKVEFLNRVEERKESMLSSQSSGSKRIRRG